ncbi:MAG: Multidrug resistance transporter, Bcr/CflA family [uncultured Propionibacteriaceae bacterium]|uniref:Multidrug resistance transporter, Bcr/CflA family n=1 Tax=uncultured Propionibacteriaceae bacterium TaxID=257457 RepID=A0A6J4MZ96_9ACTN|nr:MAG: Multidrug resistance transporter, Bcr/CflA family [uncultured Propionibacteriaceae bacterium]
MTSVAEAPAKADLIEPTTTTPPPSMGAEFVGRKYVQLVLVLGALSAISPLTIDMYLPALPQLTEEMQATPPQAQMTITGLLAGLGLGQLVVGPLSDAVGRRKPLLLGLAAHALASLLCVIAPSITLLSVTRTLQGVAGAAVAVVAMAMVRDLFSGLRAAQLLSRLVLVMGVAPILAPSFGSALLRVTSWQGIFVVLSVTAGLLFILALVALPETLPPSRRVSARPGQSLRAYGVLFKDKIFLAMVGVAGLMFATMFAYIAGSSFVLQEIYRLTPQQFGVAFGLNGIGLILMTQINPMLVKRHGPVKVLTASVTVAFLAALVLLVVTMTSFGGLVGFLVPLWFVISSAGLSFPNAPAIALNRHGEAAGTAAALLGSAQFLIGGLTAPLVGALDNGTPVPMAAVIVGTTGLASLLLFLTRRGLSTVRYD